MIGCLFDRNLLVGRKLFVSPTVGICRWSSVRLRQFSKMLYRVFDRICLLLAELVYFFLMFRHLKVRVLAVCRQLDYF